MCDVDGYLADHWMAFGQVTARLTEPLEVLLGDIKHLKLIKNSLEHAEDEYYQVSTCPKPKPERKDDALPLETRWVMIFVYVKRPGDGCFKSALSAYFSLKTIYFSSTTLLNMTLVSCSGSANRCQLEEGVGVGKWTCMLRLTVRR